MRLAVASQQGVYFDGVTGAAGAYRIESLPAGEYAPNITAPTGFYGPDPMDFATNRVRVRVKEGITKFDIEVTPASVIRGRVLSPDRRPLGGIIVYAFPLAGILLGSGKSDADGQFVIRVPRGVYRLEARPMPDQGEVTNYPDVTDAASAARIVVGEAADLGGYEIRLQRISGNSLRGVVRDDRGNAVPGATVTNSARAVRATSDDEGVFEFKSIPAGDWRISATISRDGDRWFGSAVIAMPNRDYDKAEIRIAPPFGLDLELEGAPRERRSPSFELRAADGLNGFTVREQEGRARFDRLYPGPHRLGVNGLVAGYYLKSVFLGTADVTGRMFELSPASLPLKVVYAPGPARVSGEVENGAGAKVVLISADREIFVPGTDVVPITCDANGRFTFDDLRPGDWHALAFPPATRIMSSRERVFDRGLWREAATFRVGERETATIKLKITAWPE